MSFFSRSQMPRRSAFSRVSALVAVAALGVGVVAAGCTVTTTNAPLAGCNADATVACTGATGYSCGGGSTPTETNASLVCTGGVAGVGGGVDYCCVAEAAASTTCQPNASVVGCAGGSFGFTCTNSTDLPNNAYSGLNCSTGTPGANGSLQYCCTN